MVNAQCHHQILPFCDVCPGPQMFDLHVSDCWRALARAKAEGLVDLVGFDLEEYEDIHIAPAKTQSANQEVLLGPNPHMSIFI
jgi:hypothetical protein